MKNAPLSAYLSPAGGTFIEELPNQSNVALADRHYKISTLCSEQSPAPYRSVITLTGRQLHTLCSVWSKQNAETF
jgi:hypothetical protein